METIKHQTFPPAHQNRHPGKESEMNPAPKFDNPHYKPAGKLKGKTAVVTGGDSGIGRAVAIAYAKEGANVVIAYLNENDDAATTERAVTELGGRCLKIPVDLKCEEEAERVVSETVEKFGGIDILVNNAAVQYPKNSIEDISKDQLAHTFESNVFSYFNMTKAALPHLNSGSAIINTASVAAFTGSDTLIDYSATKGAIVSFTRSTALSLADREIRVNAVAPGPVWTPLIVSSFSEDEVKTFGSDVPMGRAAEPCELAPAYVFLASEDSTYITGEVLHVNGGQVVN